VKEPEDLFGLPADQLLAVHRVGSSTRVSYKG